MAVELVDPRRALEVVSRNLSLPCRDRWLELVVIGVGCLGLDLAQRLCAAEAHLLHVLKVLARPLSVPHPPSKHMSNRNPGFLCCSALRKRQFSSPVGAI